MRLAGFMEECELRLGIRLSCYRDGNIERSIKRMMDRFGCRRLDQLLALLEGDNHHRQEFIDCLAINVTEFFRDPHHFRYIKHTILPKLLERRQSVRIWSAGCSTGQEAYSLAMLLEETDPEGKGRVVATDIDKTALAKARGGVYEKKDVAGLTVPRRRSFFVREGEQYRVCDSIAQRVTFRSHDLLTGRIPHNYYDLIAFRNVSIHFEREARNTLHRRFANALRSGGIFFVGGAEGLFSQEKHEMRMLSHGCYAREKDGLFSGTQCRLAS